jgi:hypothetical protein
MPSLRASARAGARCACRRRPAPRGRARSTRTRWGRAAARSPTWWMGARNRCGAACTAACLLRRRTMNSVVSEARSAVHDEAEVTHDDENTGVDQLAHVRATWTSSPTEDSLIVLGRSRSGVLLQLLPLGASRSDSPWCHRTCLFSLYLTRQRSRETERAMVHVRRKR